MLTSSYKLDQRTDQVIIKDRAYEKGRPIQTKNDKIKMNVTKAFIS